MCSDLKELTCPVCGNDRRLLLSGPGGFDLADNDVPVSTGENAGWRWCISADFPANAGRAPSARLKWFGRPFPGFEKLGKPGPLGSKRKWEEAVDVDDLDPQEWLFRSQGLMAGFKMFLCEPDAALVLKACERNRILSGP